jgi:hypothetical protein
MNSRFSIHLPSRIFMRMEFDVRPLMPSWLSSNADARCTIAEKYQHI